MHIVEIFLPLKDNAGAPFPPAHFEGERDRLTGQFGGLTIYRRAPAEGVWRDGGQPVSDDIVIFEVMAEDLDAVWWAEYRHRLQKLFRQSDVLIRAHDVRLLR